MHVFDRVIGFFSPERALKNTLIRDELRYYDANTDRRNSDWRAPTGGAEMIDSYSRGPLRDKARDLERNSDIANSVTAAYVRNTVGFGYNLQAKTPNERLNSQIELLWKMWCKKQYCDVTGQQSLTQMLRMLIRRKKVDGGIIFLKIYNKKRTIPFQLRALEVDQLDESQQSPHFKGNTVLDGIEYDKDGKAVYYYFKQYDIYGNLRLENFKAPAKDVIFLWTKKRPTQLREVTDFAPVLTRIRDINEYITTVSVKERAAACLSVFITRKNGTAGRLAELNNRKKEPREERYRRKKLSPGLIQELDADEDIAVVNPSGQAAETDSFLRTMQLLVSSGMGLSYEAVTRDLSKSTYSSARQGAVEDDFTYEEDVEIIHDFLDEVYETFVLICASKGILKMNVDFFSDIEKKELYLAHEFIRPPKKWIDPVKESNATQTALQSGQKTFKEMASENGRDWKQQLDDMKEVQDYAQELGLDISSMIYGTKIGGKDEVNETTDETELSNDEESGTGDDENDSSGGIVE